MKSREIAIADSLVTPDARHAALRAGLERDRENAWQIAHYERSQRDELTSKIRFSITALNAASMVTVLSLGSALAGVAPYVLTIAAGAFVVGTICGGYSLFSHQTHLITLAGDTSSRALVLDRAVSLAQFPPGTSEYMKLGEAMTEASEAQSKTYSFSAAAINLQWCAAAFWGFGAVFVGIMKSLTLF
jgi:hypothetical protein